MFENGIYRPLREKKNTEKKQMKGQYFHKLILSWNNAK